MSNNWNILLRGKYGSGKTTMALATAALCGLFLYQFPVQGKMRFSSQAAVHVVDECHTIRAFENLYGTMQEKNFIWISNLSGKLPEPFINRCFSFRLDDYNINELGKIILYHSKDLGISVEMGGVLEIAKRCRGNPRTAILLLKQVVE